jgi:hypothetical protein
MTSAATTLRLKGISPTQVGIAILLGLCAVALAVLPFTDRDVHPYQRALAASLERLEAASAQPGTIKAYSALVIDARRRLTTATRHLEGNTQLAAVDAVEGAENAQTVWNATLQEVYPEAAFAAARDLGLTKDEASWVDQVSRDRALLNDCLDVGTVAPSCAQRQTERRILVSGALNNARLRIGRALFALRGGIDEP